MRAFLLDTSALLALRDNEPGAARVSALLHDAKDGKTVVYGCFMSQMEILYRVWKDEGEAAGRAALADCLKLPISWVQQDHDLLITAGMVKAMSKLSMADAWIAAAAIRMDAILVHKDPEFESVAGLQHEPIPYKVKHR